MARVKLAKNAGFCMGVRRAMDITLEAAMRKDGPIYTYGPLIHNPQVLELLGDKGVNALNEEDWEKDLKEIGGKDSVTVIIRAHGITPEERQRIKDLGVRILNATCPHVGKVQGIIKRHAQQGYATLIWGDKDHAEVIGLLGYTGGKGIVVNSLKELASLPQDEKFCLVAQTTQDRHRFEVFAQAVQKKYPGAKIFNTICESTHRRQQEVLALAQKVDAMVVVGGKGSGNTRRLAKISEEAGVPTFHIETDKDLDLKALSAYPAIGITAGASTPTWLIAHVVERLKAVESGKGKGQFLARVARLLAISYLLLALGAGSLAYTSILIQGLRPEISLILISSFYVFSIHVLNRLMDKASEKYNQPGRMEFYERYGSWMILAAILSAGAALILAWGEGTYPFLLLLAIFGSGLVYNLSIFPFAPGRKFRYRRMRDIPGSKTIFVALAWGIVTSILPPLAQGNRFLPATAVALFFTATMVFFRLTVYDFKDIQGDLLVGKETLPIVLGRRNTEILVAVMLVCLTGILMLASLFRWASSLSSYLLLSLSYMVGYYWLYRQKFLRGGFLFEGAVEGSFLFAGAIALIWNFS
jgi:(E)-4-hydroxy-3-methyl-but-2-enyl pyrophosphate reductase